MTRIPIPSSNGTLGRGAVFDPKTYESTLRIENLHRLEMLTHKLSPPKWPAEVFGSIDDAKAKAGGKAFQRSVPRLPPEPAYALTDVGTDPQRANSFGQPVASAGGKPFPNAVQPILDGLKARAFQDDGISPAEQAAMDAPKVIWRATGQYMARPLTSKWATAPYLPQWLGADALGPATSGSATKKFTTGGTEYDPAKVGSMI